MLKEQGYHIDSVPEKGQIVYLRENSNISTGGDSIDVTDQFNDDYKKIAADAVTALQARISGIDLIIPDKESPRRIREHTALLKRTSIPLCICIFTRTKDKAAA